MSLYADYIKEREGRDILETEKGFATYIINDKECYLVDVYIKPEFRQQGIGKSFVDTISELAKEKGCEVMTTTVCPKANGSTESLKATLGVGFKLDSSVSNLILFKKEL